LTLDGDFTPRVNTIKKWFIASYAWFIPVDWLSRFNVPLDWTQYWSFWGQYFYGPDDTTYRQWKHKLINLTHTKKSKHSE